MNNILSR